MSTNILEYTNLILSTNDALSCSNLHLGNIKFLVIAYEGFMFFISPQYELLA